VGILGNLLSGAILGTLVGAVIGLFLLFQLRPKYVH
jgi:integral membrane sensor domain MASE1